jgi:uncharacterized protein
VAQKTQKRTYAKKKIKRMGLIFAIHSLNLVLYFSAASASCIQNLTRPTITNNTEGKAMSIKDTLTEDMKSAMRAKESERLLTIRSLQAAIKQKEVDERITLDDAQVIAIVDKLVKQRKDSITAFESGGRQDLADKEKAEMTILQAYLPQRMSAEEVTAAVKAIVAELGAAGPGDMGKVMGAVKTKLAGKADMGQVSAAVKAALAG